MQQSHSIPKKDVNCQKDNVKKYPKKAFLPLTVFGATALLFYVEDINLSVDYVNPYFYIALLVSILIAGIMIYIVYKATLKLDVHYNWREHQKLRLLFQSLIGLLLPLSIAFLSRVIYFNFFAINIFDTIWLSKYLPAISVLLLLINTFFAVYWLLIIEPTIVAVNAKTIGLLELNTKEEAVETAWYDEELVLSAESTAAVENNIIDDLWLMIGCIFCFNKHCFCISFTGEVLIWPHNISNSLKHLPAHQFVQVSRSYLINLAAIKNITHKGSKITLIQLIIEVENRIKKICFDDDKDMQSKTTDAIDQQKMEPYLIKLSYDRKALFIKDLKRFNQLNA